MSPRGLAFSLAAAVLLAAPVVSAQTIAVADVQHWVETDKRARPYAGIAEDLLKIFTLATEKDLPLWILFEKLNQGAAKRTPPSRLLHGLEGELDRLERARELLAPHLPRITRPGETDELLKRASLLLAGGLTTETIAAVLSSPSMTPDRLPAGLDACAALLTIAGSSRLPPESLLSIGVALVTGSLDPRAYGSVASAFSRARLGGMTDHEAATLIVTVLQANGGLVRLNQEIDGSLR